MKANLHIHSRYSDGTQWPKEIVIRAKSLGLQYIALTDHENLEGIQEFIQAAEEQGIHAIAGVEIDCVEPNYEYDREMLVYFPDKYEHTQKLLTRLRTLRIQRMSFYIEHAISEFGLKEFLIEDLAKEKAREKSFEPSAFTFQKPDLLKYLKQNYPEKFKNIDLKQFKRDYIKKWEKNMNKEWDPKLNLATISEYANKDDGIMVIPHLGLRFGKTLNDIKQNEDQYRKFLLYSKKMNVWGVELYYYKEFETNPKIIDEINAFIKGIATEFGFHFTYGSDCHGINSDSDTMERFFGDFSGF